MNNDIKSHLDKSLKIMQQLACQFETGELDEQAVPAYIGGNVLSRWIFRRRLTRALSLLPQTGGGCCVDFGCGSGLLLPYLDRHFSQTIGVDTHRQCAESFLSSWYGQSVPGSIRLCPGIEQAVSGEDRADCILALDVLEHVDNLPDILDAFARKLSPGGSLILSGPTENGLYRIGRKIVGFSGHYHHRSIYDILHACEQRFVIRRRYTLLPILPLFVIGLAQPRPNPAQS